MLSCEKGERQEGIMYTRTIISSTSDSDSVNDVPSSWVTLSKLELECDPGPCLHQLVAAAHDLLIWQTGA